MTTPISSSLEAEFLSAKSKSYSIALNAETVKDIKAIGKTMRESLFHLCVIAYGIRRKNLRRVQEGERGGNAQGQVYKEEFKKWYAVNDLQSVYGTISSFTKYAMAGRLLKFTRWQISKDYSGQKYIDRLPHRLSALYELQKIIWDSGDKATDEGRKRFKDLMIKPIEDGSTNNTWINRSLTAKKIIEQRLKFENIPVPEKNANNSYSPMKIPVLSIKAHEGLYAFNRRGNKRKVKGPDLDKVRELVTAINGLIADFGLEDFSIEDNLEQIREKYEQKKNPDFAEGIK
jgi:hypothetical protein